MQNYSKNSKLKTAFKNSHWRFFKTISVVLHTLKFGNKYARSMTNDLWLNEIIQEKPKSEPSV